MTITMTAREREVFASMIDYVRKRCANQHGINLSGNAIARWMEDWLASQTTETSASPPRVPVSSAQACSVGVESGPGQPMTDALPGEPAINAMRDFWTRSPIPTCR